MSAPEPVHRLVYTGGVEKPTARRRARAEGGGRVGSIDHGARCRILDRFLVDALADGWWIVIYDALPDEVDLGDLVAAHPDPRSRYALTRTPDRGHRLTVHPWGGPTERHRHGYRQPVLDGPTVDDAAVGAVLVPGLAFDRHGNRLGRGGGYYDRFLARLAPDVLRIGVSAGPLVDRLPVEPHDVTMTHLATADGVWSVPVTEAEPS